MKNIFFLLCCIMPLFSIGQDTLKVGEVFDFDIGDEFHYSRQVNNEYAINIERIKIWDKWFSPQLDTVFYLRHYYLYYAAYNYGYFESSEYEEFYVTNLDAYVAENIFGPDSCGNADTCVISLTFDDYCNRASMNVTIRTGLIDFEEITNETTYAEGLGVIYTREFWDDGQLNDERELVYYKKGIEECGTPNNITNIEEQTFTSEITIYPIPIENELNINLNSNDYIPNELKIFDLNGKLIVNQKITSNKTNLNLAHLNAGTYFLVLNNDGRTFNKKIIKL